MRKIFLKCMIGASLIMASCSSGDEISSDNNTGSINLAITAEAGFLPSTRAVNLNSYTNVNNYTVQILNNTSTVVKEFIYAEKPTKIELNNGSYTLKAFYGTDSDASRNAFYVEGSTTFAIEGKAETLTVDCTPVCGKVTVNFAAEMSTYFSDYSVTYETAALAANGASATWSKDDTEPWYLKVDKNGEEVKAAIRVARISDGKSSTVNRTYTLAPNKAWTLNVAPKDENGNLGISITIDEKTNDQEIDIVVPSEWI